MIYLRENVRRAVERAMLLDAFASTEDAIATVAQATGLTPESVRECLADEEQEA